MGAYQFDTTAEGATAAAAFSAAVDQAQWEHGHGGYSGTIAEKNAFEVFTVPAGMTVDEFVEQASGWGVEPTGPHADLINRAKRVYEDKWGQAVCVQVETGKYRFVGMASS